MLLFFPLLTIFSLTIIYLFLLPKYTKNDDEPIFHPPPGPKGIPFIGNLHQFDTSKPHVYLAELAKTYGPILSLRFGRVPVVAVHSAKLAKEVLKTQDLNFCSRPSLVSMQRLSYNGLDLAFAPYNEYLREIRKISIDHLLSSKRVESFAPIRQEEVSRVMKKISSLSLASKIVNLSELLMGFSASNICRIAFGKRYEDDEELSRRSRFHSMLNEVEAMFTTFFFSDYFPSIWWLDKLTGKFSRLEKIFKDMDAFYEEIINDHLDPNKPKSEREDIIDILLRLRKHHPSYQLTLDLIKAILMNIFVAGADTSVVMVVWAMTELMKHPSAMKKVQEELRNAIQNTSYINKCNFKELSYFQAVMKETFRLHPAGPLLIVRETIQKTKIEGYDILPGTLVHVNAWAIGRDPESWIDPEKFMPERFLESTINFKGCDFELIPFGAGRRVCPGLHLGVANVELVLATLLHSFDWELPSGVKKEDIDTDVLPGIAMHKKNPLCLVAKKYQGQIKP